MAYCNSCGTEYQKSLEKCQDCGTPYINSAKDKGFVNTLKKKNQLITIEEIIPAPIALRITAGVIDLIIAIGLAALLLLPNFNMLKLAGLNKIICYMAPGVYLLLKDCIEGKSIGKLFTGLTTYNFVEKKPAGLIDSIIRNWFLCLPLIGIVFLSIIVFVQILFKNNRFGDNFSNTIIIKD